MKIAIDMGHRYSKFFDGVETKMVKTILGEPHDDLIKENSKTQVNNYSQIETQEGHWFLGDTALIHSTTHITGKDESWAFYPEYRAILLYGISEYLSPNTDHVAIDLILCLPIIDYQHNNRHDLTKLLRQSHSVDRHQHGRRKLTVTIRNILWLPQAFAPAKPYLGEEKNVVSIDWGSRNINTAQFKGRQLINSKTASVEAGAANALQDIGKQIQARTKRELTEPEIVNVIKTKIVNVSGQPVDVSDIIDKRLGYYKRFYLSFISDRWGNAVDVDTFVSFGGGVIFAEDELTAKYPQMVVLDDPQYAQVKAMYEYLDRKLG